MVDLISKRILSLKIKQNSQNLSGALILSPNLEIEIHDFASSLHPWALHKIIAEPTGATQI